VRIEHIAFNVQDPVAFVQWYVTNLGYSIRRESGPPVHMHFIADSSGSVLLEVYGNDKAPVPDYPRQDPLVVHVAYASDNIAADRGRLLDAGATIAQDTTTTPAGDTLCMLRDPWGFPIQLVQRAEPLL
jgi:glyoxylase I family protein